MSGDDGSIKLFGLNVARKIFVHSQLESRAGRELEERAEQCAGWRSAKTEWRSRYERRHRIARISQCAAAFGRSVRAAIRAVGAERYHDNIPFISCCMAASSTRSSPGLGAQRYCYQEAVPRKDAAFMSRAHDRDCGANGFTDA